jgi:hypothetical protein
VVVDLQRAQSQGGAGEGSMAFKSTSYLTSKTSPKIKMTLLHIVLLFAFGKLGHATASYMQLAIPAGIPAMKSNASHPVQRALDERADLQIRDQCAANSSPDCGYCSG